MTVSERTRTIEERIGANGVLEVKMPDASVRLRAVDGDVVRGWIAGEDGDELIRVDASDGRLVLSTDGRWRAFGLEVGLAFLGFGSQRRFDIELDVPRKAEVSVEVASGVVRGEGLCGRQRYRTASGEIELGGSAGVVEVEAVSGGVRLSGPGPVNVRARTISGAAEVDAGSIESLSVATTSGDVRLGGSFRQGEHRVSTISGDTRIAVRGGLRVEASTVSGDITSEVPHRTQPGRGNRVLVVGDGAATLLFKSVSGDLRLIARDGTPPDRAGERSGSIDPRWNQAQPPPSTDRLGILEALERGEIGVDEANRWLSLLRDEA